MKSKKLIVFLIMALVLIGVYADNARRMVYLSDVTAIGDGNTGNLAKVRNNSMQVLTVGGESTGYADADEAIVEVPCIVSAISFYSDTAGDEVLFYDGYTGSDTQKWHMSEGLADHTQTMSFPGGLKFDTECYVDMAAGNKVTIVYSTT